jgi:hypothetical protein
VISSLYVRNGSKAVIRGSRLNVHADQGAGVRASLILLFAIVASISQPAASNAAGVDRSHANQPIMLDAKGDVVRFYGVPTNLTPAGLKRLPYRYKVGHFSAEGDKYTFYTIRAQGGVDVKVQFDHGRLDSARTSSPNAVGPKSVGVGSLLSAVKAAWPKGHLNYGVEENEAYVSYQTEEPGFSSSVMYYFDPKDMPPKAFDRDYQTSQSIDIPNIAVKTIGIFPRRFAEENYDFLSVTTGPCAPKNGIMVGPNQRLVCKRLTQPLRYRGTWLVGSKTSLFTPSGSSCIDAKSSANCAQLLNAKDALASAIRRDSSWACLKMYRVEFIGRRNVLPNVDPAYRITVDELLAYWPLPDPPHKPDECGNPPD